jgi:quinol monooxygenase YgiN
MIVISGILTLDPAKASLALELTTTLCAATREEPGNGAYEYWQDPADAGRWRVFEEWEDDDALNAHMASPHMAAFLGSAGDLGITGIDISRYDVDKKSKFM